MSFKQMSINLLIIISIVNTISILMINLFNLFWLYFNHSNTFNPLYGFSGSLSYIFYCTLIFLDIFQGLVSIIPPYSDFERAPLYLCFISTLFYLLLFLLSFKKYLYSFMDYLFFNLVIFTVVSGIFQIILVSVLNKLIIINTTLIKFAVEILNTIIIFILIYSFKL